VKGQVLQANFSALREVTDLLFVQSCLLEIASLFSRLFSSCYGCKENICDSKRVLNGAVSYFQT